eukprot:7104484-Prymnesium_polylepis.2
MPCVNTKLVRHAHGAGFPSFPLYDLRPVARPSPSPSQDSATARSPRGAACTNATPTQDQPDRGLPSASAVPRAQRAVWPTGVMSHVLTNDKQANELTYSPHPRSSAASARALAPSRRGASPSTSGQRRGGTFHRRPGI